MAMIGPDAPSSGGNAVWCSDNAGECHERDMATEGRRKQGRKGLHGRQGRTEAGAAVSGGILALGDTHGDWACLASVLRYYRPVMCFVAGDFGWWPGICGLPHTELPRDVLEQTELHFLDGNHENHASLLAAAPRGCFEAVEIAPRVVYHPRGSVTALPDGRTVFFAGGAMSVDRRRRTAGVDWFREEILQRRHLPKKLPRVDIVMSHTVPFAFGIEAGEPLPMDCDGTPDPSQDVLDEVLDICRPKLWIAGHKHRRVDGECGGTEFHVLDYVRTGCCFPTGMKSAFWLSGGPGVEREGPGWMLGEDVFLSLVTNEAGNYGCADMAALPQPYRALFEERRLMYATQKVRGVKGIKPGEADSFISTLCRFGWNPEAARGDRKRD